MSDGWVMRKKKKNMRLEHIGSVMEKVMGDLEKASGPLMVIWQAWSDVVGPVTAKNASPVELKGKILVVNVAGSVWLQELRFSNRDIIEKINSVLENSLLEDIQYRIGPIKR
jgi:predicted nucleic acid-binding Zn ribbon protein